MAKSKGLLISLAIIVLLILGIGGFLYFKKLLRTNYTSISSIDFVEGQPDEESSIKGEETEGSSTGENNINPDIAEPTKNLEVSGWIANWATNDGLTTFKNNSIITSVSPTWYYLNGDGSLGFKSGAHSSSLIDTVHARKGKVIPSVSNPSAGELSKVLNNQTLREKLINNLVNETEKYSYDGIDIDFEDINADDSEVFTDFIAELSDALHSRDKVLTIAVLAKTDEFIYSLSESRVAQDWSKLSPHVDEFRIMGYDFEHNSTTSAGPIAPTPWLEDVLEYAVKHVPENKIVLGLPLYGYHWVKGGKTTSFTWQTEQSLEDEWGIQGKLDSTSKEKYLVNDSSELWYQDAESIKYRIDLAEKYKVKGVVFWRLGKEDPEIWELF